jgi:Holliday junction resolvase RusA-like endonuclease
MIIIEINGVPVPQHRPRCTRTGNVYDDQKLVKEQYRWQIKSQFRNEPLTTPIALDIIFHMPIPKGTSSIKKKAMINNVIHHMKKPDCDNLIKFCGDTLNGIVFKDDAQICEIRAKKVYSENPGTTISIKSLSLHQENENNL